LDTDRSLKAQGLSQEGAILQLVLRSLPELSEFRPAEAALQAGLTAIEAYYTRQANAEIHKDMDSTLTPHLNQLVRRAVLYLLAGVEPNIERRRHALPKDATWNGCTQLLTSTSFLMLLRELPDAIARGKCTPALVSVAKGQLQAIPGASNEEKITARSRQQLAASRLYAWVLYMVEYYEAATQISEHFGMNVFDIMNQNSAGRQRR